jgi:hypothetical protein
MTRVRLSAAAAFAAAFVLVLAMVPAGAATPAAQASWGARLTCTADASGYCVVPHPVGVVPDSVTVTPELPAMVSVDQLTAVSFRARFCRLVSSTGACTALTGSRAFYAHIDYTPGGPSPSPSTSATPSASPVPSGSPTVSPTPPSSPSPTPGPVAAWPDASNTGVPAGVTLTVMSGDQTFSTPNQVIDARDINGCVSVTAPGVHITRSKIRCASFEVVQHGDRGVQDVTPSGCGPPPALVACTWVPLAISDSEIWCTSGTGGTAVGDTNVTLDRVNIHGCENGFDADQWVTVQNSWIHDLLGDVGHTDGLQMAHYLNGCATSACEVSHARFVDVIHNRIEAIAGTSAIISNPSGDSDVTIRGNLLTGGAYTLYCPYSGVAGPNWFARDNRFIRTSSRPNGGEFGPWTGCEDEVPANVTGNVWDDNNAPLN